MSILRCLHFLPIMKSKRFNGNFGGGGGGFGGGGFGGGDFGGGFGGTLVEASAVVASMAALAEASDHSFFITDKHILGTVNRLSHFICYLCEN